MIPSKPFETFKWRWLSVQPTEGLLQPPVFLGVLRAFSQFDNRSSSDPELLDALYTVQNETNTNVNLVRTPERNLVRNSGQYWKGTGLIKHTHGTIELTPLGTRVSSGEVTQGEFAAIMIQQVVLPNLHTYTQSEVQKWNDAGLEIRPLALILTIMDALVQTHGIDQGYLTPNELIRITIPLSGINADLETHVSCLMKYRGGTIDVTVWPDCAPGSNDKRFAREFLIFLANFDFCSTRNHENSEYETKYYLAESLNTDIIQPTITQNVFDTTENSADQVVSVVREIGLPFYVERQRSLASIIMRPEQPRFRREVLSSYGGQCFLTGERIEAVLEAAHILPVKYDGADHPGNGICLRADIHRLFDSGNIRIEPNGQIRHGESVRSSGNYDSLPDQVTIPDFVDISNLEWRIKYC